MTSVAEYELKADMIRDITHHTLEETFNIDAEGYCCDGEMLVDVLLKAASENSSVEAACQDLSEVADSNTLREHLNVQFDVSELWQQEAQVKRAYRRRFGIECSYRQLRRLRIIITSRNPAFRFFVLGFGLLLVTIWAHLRWLFCRIKGRGRPRIDETRMRLQQFICLLRRTIEQLYGVVMAIPTHHPPQSVIY